MANFVNNIANMESGYQVKLKRNGEEYSKDFVSSDYESDSKTLETAKLYRDDLYINHPHVVGTHSGKPLVETWFMRYCNGTIKEIEIQGKDC